MTAEECQQCNMINPKYHFISVPDMLSWANGKVNVMYCVKESIDIPRAISTLVENNATHRAFLEVHVDEFIDTVTSNVPNWEEVYYVIEIKHPEDIDVMFESCNDEALKRSFLFEFQNYEDFPDVQSDIARVKAKGIRTMAVSRDSPFTATVQNHLDLFNAGFDVAYTYNLANAVEARIQVNTDRNISPA